MGNLGCINNLQSRVSSKFKSNLSDLDFDKKDKLIQELIEYSTQFSTNLKNNRRKVEQFFDAAGCSKFKFELIVEQANPINEIGLR